MNVRNFCPKTLSILQYLYQLYCHFMCVYATTFYFSSGVIVLTNCLRVSASAPLKGHKNVFDVCTKERTYHLAAETPTEKHEWMETLNQLLFTDTNNEVFGSCPSPPSFEPA